MKKIIALCAVILSFALLSAFVQKTSGVEENVISPASGNADMKTYVIERIIPGAGKLTAAELKSISQVSCGVLKEMGAGIQWLHSYVTGDKIYCIYKAENRELVEEHAKKGGFPANSINEVAAVISPKTAE